jgi:hypothetical protein
MSDNVDKLIRFADELVGIKYTGWKGDGSDDHDAFFMVDGVPSIEFLRENGVCCTSFINILRQSIGSKIPESDESCRGGTLFWYTYLKDKGVLNDFDYTCDYPIGTLFLRNYRDVKDQGHVAILHSKNKDNPTHLLYSRIIHASSDSNQFQDGKPQVNTTILGYSHFCYYGGEKGYYEYAIYPNDWLC